MQTTQKMRPKDTLDVQSRLLINVSEKGIEFISFSDDPTIQTAAIKKCTFIAWTQSKINNADICNKLDDGLDSILTETPVLQFEPIDDEKVLEERVLKNKNPFCVVSKKQTNHFDEVTFCFSSKWIKEQKLPTRKIEASKLKLSLLSKLKQEKPLVPITKSLIRELNADAIEKTDHDSDRHTLIEARTIYRLDDSPEEYSFPPYKKRFHQLTLNTTLIKIDRLMAEALSHFIKKRLKSNAVFFTSERAELSHLVPKGDALLIELGDKATFIHKRTELQDWTDSLFCENKFLQCLSSDLEIWRPKLDEIDQKILPQRGERNPFFNEKSGTIQIANILQTHGIEKNKNSELIWKKLSQEHWNPLIEKLREQINPTTTLRLVGNSPLALSSLMDAIKREGWNASIAWPTVSVPSTTSQPSARGVHRAAQIYYTQGLDRFPASSLPLRRTRKSAKAAAALFLNLAVLYITKKQTTLNA